MLALRTERVSGHRIAAIVLGVLATVLVLWPKPPSLGATRMAAVDLRAGAKMPSLRTAPPLDAHLTLIATSFEA